MNGRALSYTEAAMAALTAGCDLAMLCNQSLANSEGGGRALNELIAAMTEAQVKGQWQASDASEARRRALLPRVPAPDWDSLMVQPAYMHALDWIV